MKTNYIKMKIKKQKKRKGIRIIFREYTLKGDIIGLSKKRNII